MKILFDNVVPGFPVGGADIERLKRQIHALLEGVGFTKASYRIPDFKDSQGALIDIHFTVASIDKEAVHLTGVKGSRR